MEKIYFAISYIDDFGVKHLATVFEQWEVNYYKRRFYQVSVSVIAA